ncbi:MAG TPA: type II toxin-antitoxin system VapC family toxin [Streptosporangiaceae bacterium]|nr:type II toxin-antitoxin system VapC family toxin [Streptosporangiaceae bacterium]
MIVVDTNVVSELMRPSPSQAVQTWFEAQAANDLYVTAVTVAEIRYGLARLPMGRRQDRLREAADEVFSTFAEFILPFDTAAAIEYAEIATHCESLGRSIEGFDAQIAAICRAHEAVLATGNTKDFQDTGVRLVSPWEPN